MAHRENTLLCKHSPLSTHLNSVFALCLIPFILSERGPCAPNYPSFPPFILIEGTRPHWSSSRRGISASGRHWGRHRCSLENTGDTRPHWPSPRRGVSASGRHWRRYQCSLENIGGIRPHWPSPRRVTSSSGRHWGKAPTNHNPRQETFIAPAAKKATILPTIPPQKAR